MNTPGSMLLGAVILAATYAALNVYEVRTDNKMLWRFNRITGEAVACFPRRCLYGQKWEDVSAQEAAARQQPRTFTFEEAFGKPAAPDKPPAKDGE